MVLIAESMLIIWSIIFLLLILRKIIIFLLNIKKYI